MGKDAAVLLGEPTTSPAFIRAFIYRLSQAIASLRSAHPSALLCIIVDAADNAQMAAEETGESRSFIKDLLREGLPEGKPTAADLTRFIEIDTVDANRVLGFDDDERDYGVAVRMLQMLGCTRVRLMTNNPSKLDGLARAGIDVFGRVPLHGPINADNHRYLAAKATRSGHQLDHVLGAFAGCGGIRAILDFE